MKIATVIEQLGLLADKLQQEHEMLHNGSTWRETNATEFRNWIGEQLGESVKNKFFITDNGLVEKLTFLAPPMLRAHDCASHNDNMKVLREYTTKWHNDNRSMSQIATGIALAWQNVGYNTGISMMGQGEYAGTLSLASNARIAGYNIPNATNPSNGVSVYDIDSHGWMRTLQVFKMWAAAGTKIDRDLLKLGIEKNKQQRLYLAKETEVETTVPTGYAKLVENKQWATTSEDTLADFTKHIAEKLENNLTARTWGWEVEVPDAKNVSAPQGVEKGSDGSLRSYENNEDCECDCDSCYYHECDCDHCETGSSDPEHNCGSSMCDNADKAEYRTIGGVQRSIHGALVRLCAELNDNDAEKNDTAGTHIHVWAGDLNAKQVANVMAIYRLLQPMFNAVAGRINVNYSRTLDKNTIAQALKGKLPSEKSRDVNLGHLGMTPERRTIEFRQMDCNLDSNRILGWAWMVRGLVTAAKRGLQIHNALHVTNIAQYVEMLAKFNVTTSNEKPDEIVYGSRHDMNEIINRKELTSVFA